MTGELWLRLQHCARPAEPSGFRSEQLLGSRCLVSGPPCLSNFELDFENKNGANVPLSCSSSEILMMEPVSTVLGLGLAALTFSSLMATAALLEDRTGMGRRC